jgi:LacI family transcriptional regulator
MMIAKKAFDHFRRLGFKRFAYCGIDWLYWSKERGRALEYILQINGYDLTVYPIPKNKTLRKWENEKSLLSQWLRSLPKPIAMLAANDFRAKEVLQLCQETGIQVPEQIAILGVDDDDCICPFTNPPLSSIGRFFAKAGYEAALCLKSLMMGETPAYHEVVIEPKDVVQRQSTNILSVDHPDVAEALLFIRANKSKPLSAIQVAEHVALHKRVLYDLFKKYIGHTVYDEIKQTQTDEIARLLLETNLTVTEIAHKMGFQEVTNFARYFVQAKGMSPKAYREHYIPF